MKIYEKNHLECNAEIDTKCKKLSGIMKASVRKSKIYVVRNPLGE